MAINLDLINSNTTANIATNFSRVKIALQDAIGRNGTLPNHMTADFDMDGNDILNAGNIDAISITLDGELMPPGGFQGWSPVFGAEEYNGTIIMKLVDYAGGSGVKPTNNIGMYVGENGYVSNPDNAVNFGSAGVADGDKGDVQVSNSGTDWRVDRLEVESRNWAVSNLHPVQAPSFIRTAGFLNPGKGGGEYHRVDSEPLHPGKFSIVLDDGTTEVWYELSDSSINPYQFGALGDDVADDSDALDDMFYMNHYRGGGRISLAKGIYKISRNIAPPISLTSRTFIIEGDGMGVSIINGGTDGFGLKIYADTPPSRPNAFVELDLHGFAVIGSALNGIGIDIYSMQRAKIGMVKATGFNYGIRIRSSWNITINDRCQFIGNNVGIKIPKRGSGADLNEGFNAATIRDVNVHNNYKAGISVAMGNVIDITNVLYESCPVGIYLVDALQKVTLDLSYYEAGSITLVETNRAGALQPYLIYSGKDEDGDLGDTEFPIKELLIVQEMKYYGDGAVHLDNVDHVVLPISEIGRGYISLGDNVRNVIGTDVAGENAISTLLQDRVTGSRARRVFKSTPNNFIPNGAMDLPTLPAVHLTASAGVASVAPATVDIHGTNSRVMRVTCPDGAATVTVSFYVALGNEFSRIRRDMVAAARFLADDEDVTSVTLNVLNNNGNQLPNTLGTATDLDDWVALNVGFDPRRYLASTAMLLVQLTITRDTAVGAITIDIDEIVLAEEASAGNLQLSPLDFLAGLSGRITCSTDAGGGWYYGEVNPSLTVDYRVIASRVYAAGTAGLKVQYLSGPDVGKFRLWTDTSDAEVDYLIIPSEGRTP